MQIQKIQSQFKTVALVGRSNTPGIAEPLTALAQTISKRGFEVVFEAQTAEEIGAQGYPALQPAEIGARADVAVVLGGDGTMLGIGRQLAPYRTPLIGINHGRLGFITDIAFSEMQEVVPQLLAGSFEREERSLLESRITRDGDPIYHALAFNDVVVNRSGFSGMAELRVNVDGRFMYNQRSDGLIVATPTGSTAYALSSQGPILHPQLQGIVLVPIAPHALSNRPIVLPDDCKVSIQIVAGRDVNVNFDMQSFTALELNDVIEVRRSRHTVPFLHPVGYSYYRTLRKKLHWNEHPSLQGDPED
ncbi:MULTISPECIES: NAD kinase [Paraburkholderia]|uniref:NAD kinase n=3 Tax=Paraburkholderia TaxID=1822464 RepID=A0A2U1AAP0_9BURK|nr:MULTISPECIES: NAD kinase [Paraburkholderia]MBB2930692.1 NAD+ kinase [Paraburkholderia silvatlantica]MCP3714248.1 NAD kinase [Paraburkholderia sp. CNPSo 3281]PVY31846.1 NAD+ kinase [Paraburkholderia silvatlantica]PXW37417.1 NAD+ kinase [Paraburkholderia silvatlantica]PYE17827.1 NAD+ kinase [Paraburkholderia silvatlantica]